MFKTAMPAMLLAMSAWAGPLAADDTGKKFAVLAGVRGYRHDSLPDLKFTEADVNELATVLRKSGFDVALLTSSLGGAAEPNAANLEAALAGMLAKVGKHDTVLVGLAGHGIQPIGGTEQFFCPADANPATKERLLSLTALSGRMQASGAGVKLLMVDACRNDPDPSRGGRGGVEGDKYALPPNATNFLAMFSCSSGQRAYESEKAGGGHGVFFHHVLEGLKGQAVDPFGDGEVGWDSLAGYVKRKVPASVQEWIAKDVRQTVHTVANADLVTITLVPANLVQKPVPVPRPAAPQTLPFPSLGGKAAAPAALKVRTAESYAAGQKLVWFEPIHRQWEKGEYVGATPDGRQPIIRTRPGDPNSQAAYYWERLRPASDAAVIADLPIAGMPAKKPAQAAANSYQAGDKILWLDRIYNRWEPGEFVEATPGGKQPIIWKKRGDPNSRAAHEWENIKADAAP